MDQTPEEEKIGKEEKRSEYSMDDPAGIQRGTLDAVVERLRNFASSAVANKQFREMGMPGIPSVEQDLDGLLTNLENFYTNMDAASSLLLPKGSEILAPSPLSKKMPDLYHTDYKKALAEQVSTSAGRWPS